MNTMPIDTPPKPATPFAPRSGRLLAPQRPGDSCRAATYELRFRSLFDDGRALAFPCDEQGHVDLDALSPRALNNYCYARTVVGREFCTPAVRPAWSH